jgi:HEAT repeat protein
MMKKKQYVKLALVAVVIVAAAGYLLTGQEKEPPRQVGPTLPATEMKAAADADVQKRSVPAEAPRAAESPDQSKSATSAQVTDKDMQAPPSTEALTAEELRELVAQFLAYRRNPTPEAVEALADYLEHPERVVADQALEALTVIARDGLEREAILKILKEKSQDTAYAFRGKALYMATLVGPDEMLPVIGEYIQDPDESTQADSYDAATRALSLHIRPESLPYVDALLSKTHDSELRRNCFEILAKIDSPEALATLEAQVQAAKGQDQITSAAALARLERPEVVDYLADAIQSGLFYRETVDRISYSPVAPEVFDRLLNSETLVDDRKIELLKTLAENSGNGNQQLRYRMTDTMASLIQETANPEIKTRAIKVIGELGTINAPDILEVYLTDDTPQVRKEAFYIYMNFTTPYNYEVLNDFLWDEDEQIRRMAMSSLARFAIEDDIEILTKASQHEDEFIRNQAISVLDQLEGKE